MTSLYPFKLAKLPAALPRPWSPWPPCPSPAFPSQTCRFRLRKQQERLQHRRQDPQQERQQQLFGVGTSTHFATSEPWLKSTWTPQQHSRELPVKTSPRQDRAHALPLIPSKIYADNLEDSHATTPRLNGARRLVIKSKTKTYVASTAAQLSTLPWVATAVHRKLSTTTPKPKDRFIDLRRKPTTPRKRQMSHSMALLCSLPLSHQSTAVKSG